MAGGGLEEWRNRKGSFDAKALYVSDQVDKTMGQSVFVAPLARK